MPSPKEIKFIQDATRSLMRFFNSSFGGNPFPQLKKLAEFKTFRTEKCKFLQFDTLTTQICIIYRDAPFLFYGFACSIKFKEILYQHLQKTKYDFKDRLRNNFILDNHWTPKFGQFVILKDEKNIGKINFGKISSSFIF